MVKKSDNPLRAKINQNFIIRWKLKDEQDSHLISAGKYQKLVGEELKSKHFRKVLKECKDRYTFLIRNRLRIEFISK